MGYIKIKCGCLGCGRTFRGSNVGKIALKPAIEHMETCCPEIMAQYGSNLLSKCQIGCKSCLVPGFVGVKGGVAKDYLYSKYIPPASKLPKAKSASANNCSWKKYEYKLRGGAPVANFFQSAQPSNNDSEEVKQFRETLKSKMESDLSLNAYRVGEAMGPRSAWIDWVVNLAVNYPERIKSVWEEHQNDVHENINQLDKLSEETREGYSGSRAYITALNCITQDAFTRCSVPLPPNLNFEKAVYLRGRGGDPQYKAQMRAWRGYRHRVFGIIDFIEKNPVVISVAGGAKSVESSLPTIVPAKKRA